jgi:hypothetical protein
LVGSPCQAKTEVLNDQHGVGQSNHNSRSIKPRHDSWSHLIKCTSD